MSRRARWRERRIGSSSGSALRPVQTSSAQLRQRPWIGSSDGPGSTLFSRRMLALSTAAGLTTSTKCASVLDLSASSIWLTNNRPISSETMSAKPRAVTLEACRADPIAPLANLNGRLSIQEFFCTMQRPPADVSLFSTEPLGLFDGVERPNLSTVEGTLLP
jgi:hypothetical protein